MNLKYNIERVQKDGDNNIICCKYRLLLFEVNIS